MPGNRFLCYQDCCPSQSADELLTGLRYKCVPLERVDLFHSCWHGNLFVPEEQDEAFGSFISNGTDNGCGSRTDCPKMVGCHPGTVPCARIPHASHRLSHRAMFRRS